MQAPIILAEPLKVVLGEKPPKKKRIRVLRPSDIVNKQRYIYPFEGKFFESFGKPEKYAKWFFTGPSFSGKSTLMFIICQYLSRFGTVDYNNHEEAGGDSETVVQKIGISGMNGNNGIRLYKAPLESDVYETFYDRLIKRKSASFAVLDSIQHAEMNKKSYLHYTDSLCNPRKGKSMLFVSHWVKNDFTKFVKHDCDIKVEVIGYVAHIESRYGGNKPFLIYEQAAKTYWGKNYNKVIDGRYWPGKKK